MSQLNFYTYANEEVDAAMNGILVSLEGISGSGKTYFITELRKEMRDINFTFLSEIMDQNNDGLYKQISAALRYSNDMFFRGGLPRSETFLLLALKMCDYETSIAAALDAGAVVVEDRSIDSIAVYQSIMLCPERSDLRADTASEIYTLAVRWRRPPDITFLIEDDFNTSIKRAQKRDKRIYSNDELEVLRAAAKVYVEHAERYAARIVRIDRRTMNNNNEVLQAMRRIILDRFKSNE